MSQVNEKVLIFQNNGVKNEDRHVKIDHFEILLASIDNEPQHFSGYAVMDGHMGSEVADYLEKNLNEIIFHITMLTIFTDIEEFLEVVFRKADEQVRKLKGGSTLTLVLYNETDIVSACCGDSPIKIYHKNSELISTTYSNRYTCYLITEEEEEQLLKHGTFLIRTDELRLYNKKAKYALNMSHSIGDAVLHTFHTPIIRKFDRKNVDTIQLLTDGVPTGYVLTREPDFSTYFFDDDATCITIQFK